MSVITSIRRQIQHWLLNVQRRVVSRVGKDAVNQVPEQSRENMGGKGLQEALDEQFGKGLQEALDEQFSKGLQEAIGSQSGRKLQDTINVGLRDRLKGALGNLLGNKLLGARGGLLGNTPQSVLEYSGCTFGGATEIRRITFSDGRVMRLLLVEGTQQSAIWLTDPAGDPPFPYLQLFDLAFYTTPLPERLLLIGGGAFVWPRHILHTYPQACLDVVELDEQIVNLARDWFGLQHLEKMYGPTGENRLHISVSDGRYFLESLSPQVHYDVILNDSFVAERPAESLMDDAAVALIHRQLQPGGMYISNIVSALLGSEAAVLNAILDVLCRYFAYVEVIPCTREEPEIPSNVVVIASDTQRSFPGTWLSCTGNV